MAQSTDYETMYGDLLEFLYAPPWGLIQTDRNGAILMLNPVAAKILMPVAGNGRLDNVFRLLRSARPEIETLARLFEGRYGIVCEDLSVDFPHASPLSLSIFVQNESRLMMVLRESQLRVRDLDRLGACEELEILIDHAHIGILTTQYTTVKHANLAAQSLLGIKPEDLTGDTLDHYFSDDGGQALLDESLPLLLAGERFQGLARLTVQAQTKTICVTAVPPGKVGDETHWVLVEQCAETKR